jgi:hypothetical protein
MMSLERDERMKITIGVVVIEPKNNVDWLWVSSWSMSSPKLPYNPDNNVTLIQAVLCLVGTAEACSLGDGQTATR